MKRTMALVVSLVMVFSMMFTCNAAGETTVPVNADVKTDIFFGKGGTDFQSYYATTEPGSFDLKATVDMTDVNIALGELVALNAVKAQTATIAGGFKLTVNIDTKLDIPSVSASNLKCDIDGVEADFAKFFVVPTDADITLNGTTLTVDVAVKDGVKGTDVYDFVANKSKIGSKINIVASNVVSTRYADVFTVRGTATGKTTITGVDTQKKYEITYNFKDVDTGASDINATLEVRIKQSGGGGGGSWPTRPNTSGTTPTTPVTPSNKVSVKFVTADGTVVSSTTVAPGASVDLTKVDAGKREGFVFAGWSVNGVVSYKAIVNEDTVVKAKWVNLNAPKEFVSDDHIAYIQGYPDGNVKPEANITREEVATIIYRLLTAEKKAEIASTENNFSDVAADKWSIEAISTLANGGYISGYEDGTFKPEAPITRGEFVAIIARFVSESAKDAGFSDVADHWAKDAINKVVNMAWIEGYADGTFRPDAPITRAEVATIVNRMLVRYADANDAANATKSFADNSADAWYYLAMVEATNGHSEYGRRENGYDEIWGAENSESENVEVDDTNVEEEIVEDEAVEDIEPEK